MKNIGLTLKNARENKDYTQKRVMELTELIGNLCRDMRTMLQNPI